MDNVVNKTFNFFFLCFPICVSYFTVKAVLFFPLITAKKAEKQWMGYYLVCRLSGPSVVDKAVCMGSQ